MPVPFLPSLALTAKHTWPKTYLFLLSRLFCSHNFFYLPTWQKLHRDIFFTSTSNMRAHTHSVSSRLQQEMFFTFELMIPSLSLSFSSAQRRRKTECVCDCETAILPPEKAEHWHVRGWVWLLRHTHTHTHTHAKHQSTYNSSDFSFCQILFPRRALRRAAIMTWRQAALLSRKRSSVKRRSFKLFFFFTTKRRKKAILILQVWLNCLRHSLDVKKGKNIQTKWHDLKSFNVMIIPTIMQSSRKSKSLIIWSWKYH